MPTTHLDPRLEAAARTMREQAGTNHQVPWTAIPEERRAFWRGRAAAVLAAADAAK